VRRCTASCPGWIQRLPTWRSGRRVSMAMPGVENVSSRFRRSPDQC
jgi:hypothetical protein